MKTFTGTIDDTARLTSTEDCAFAGFWRRLGAFMIDVLPITFIIAACFYLFLGFDETWQIYRADPSNLQHRIQFLAERNQIRDLSLLVYLLYSIALEASALQGTLGKVALRIRVVNAAGNRISVARSIGRNVFKLVSVDPNLAFLAIFSRDCRDFGVIYSDFGYRKQPISYLKIAQI